MSFVQKFLNQAQRVANTVSYLRSTRACCHLGSMHIRTTPILIYPNLVTLLLAGTRRGASLFTVRLCGYHRVMSIDEEQVWTVFHLP